MKLDFHGDEIVGKFMYSVDETVQLPWEIKQDWIWDRRARYVRTYYLEKLLDNGLLGTVGNRALGKNLEVGEFGRGPFWQLKSLFFDKRVLGRGMIGRFPILKQ